MDYTVIDTTNTSINPLQQPFQLFETLPTSNVLIMADAPRFTIVAATAKYVHDAALERHNLIGKSIFEAFPPSADKTHLSGENDLRASFNEVIRSSKSHTMPVYRYDIRNAEGIYCEQYWSVINSPVLNRIGEVAYIIHTPTNVTEQVKLSKREETLKGIEQAHHLFMQAPVAIHIFRGPDFVIELANEHTLRLWGRGPEVVGQRIEDALPEIRGKGFTDLMREVMETGKKYEAYETSVVLHRYGKPEEIFVNFVFQPYYEDSNKKVVGVLAVASEVTEQVIAKRKAQEKEQRLHSIVTAAPAAIGLFVGRDLIIESPNQAFIDIVGKGPNIEGKPLREVMPELVTENQPFLQILDDVYTSGEMFQSFGSMVAIVQNGVMTKRYYNITYTPLFDKEGQVFAILDIAIDVTEQVTAREQSQKSEQELRSVVESAPFPIGVYVGREMRIALTNQAILDAWGRTPDIIGKTYQEVLPELEDQHIFEKLVAVYDTGKAYHAKNERVDLMIDGKLQTFYFNYSFTPLFDADGTVYGVMNTGADVTDLNLARQQVEESNRNLRQMVLQAPVAIGILRGPQHIVETANERMYELWGKPAAQMEGKPVFEGLPEAKEQGLEALLHDVFTTGKSLHAFEHPVSLPRGNRVETTYLNFVYQPMYEVNGVIDGVIVVATEVTSQVESRHKIEEAVAQRTKELAQANDALLRSNQELARSNQNLEEFAYAASHDLKEPIRKIHFFSDRIKDRLQDKLEDEDIRLFSRMENASKRMSSLIEDLLSYSQVSLRPKAIDKIDMNDLINQVLSDLDLEIEDKDAVVQLAPLFMYEGYQRQLQQMFHNLIGNALKYSKPGVPPVIEIGYAKEKGFETGLTLTADEKEKTFHVIKLKDNGIGFEQRDAERIFNVFTRLHGNSEYKGTGVGLSIVRKVLKNHNGFVTAYSQPGEGSVFTIYLPERIDSN